MVSEIRIYVEGGGDGGASRRQLREGFSRFLSALRDLARKKRMRWEIIACGGRNSTFDDFQRAIKTHPDAFNVLLVDSESHVDLTPWEHLKRQDRWQCPNGAADCNCHFMVQAMEAWLIADPDAIAAFYGKGFNRRALPKSNNVEQITKARLVPSINHAVKATKKRRYHKIDHGPKVLELANLNAVCMRAHYCRRLRDTLTAEITGA